MDILIAIDDSDPARKARDHVFENYPDEEITVLHVLSPPEAMIYGEVRIYADWEGIMEERREYAEELFEEARERADEYGATIATDTTIGRPAREIVEYVEDHDIDHVFVGSHGRAGVSRVLLGSVAETVVRRAPVPVTVVR